MWLPLTRPSRHSTEYPDKTARLQGDRPPQLTRPELVPALRPGPLPQRKLLEKLPSEMHLILKIFRHTGMCFLGLLMKMESWAASCLSYSLKRLEAKGTPVPKGHPAHPRAPSPNGEPRDAG